MRVLFDQGPPVPLRRFLTQHEVSTAYERGWAQVTNGNLLVATEAQFRQPSKCHHLISIGMICKKIRGENKVWQRLEKYMSEHSDTVFSHGICPECLDKEMKKLDCAMCADT